MPDILTKSQRSLCMSHIRSRNTRPEVLVRKSLHGLGYRFRINVKSLPGTPDIVLPRYRSVIFVNGCFWHGHKGCRYYTVPKTNTGFWQEKVRKNIERDEMDIQRLESMGWSVITVWECELKSSTIDSTMERVVAELTENRYRWEKYQARRRADRAFALEESRRRKATREDVERELREQFGNQPLFARTSEEMDND